MFNLKHILDGIMYLGIMSLIWSGGLVAGTMLTAYACTHQDTELAVRCAQLLGILLFGGTILGAIGLFIFVFEQLYSYVTFRLQKVI